MDSTNLSTPFCSCIYLDWFNIPVVTLKSIYFGDEGKGGTTLLYRKKH